MLGLVIETVTPGKAPPLESAARPVIVAVAVWADAVGASISKAARATQRALFHAIHLITPISL